MFRTGKQVDTKSRFIVTGDLVRENGERMAMGMGFPLGVMEMC